MNLLEHRKEEAKRTDTTESARKRADRQDFRDLAPVKPEEVDSHRSAFAIIPNVQDNLPSSSEPIDRGFSKANIFTFIIILGILAAMVRVGLLRPISVGIMLFSGFLSRGAANVAADKAGHRRIELGSFKEACGEVLPLGAGPVIVFLVWLLYNLPPQAAEGCSIFGAILGLLLGFYILLLVFSLVVGGLLYLFIRLFGLRPVISLSTWLIFSIFIGAAFAAPFVVQLGQDQQKSALRK